MSTPSPFRSGFESGCLIGLAIIGLIVLLSYCTKTIA